jgi:hypothetical protein
MSNRSNGMKKLWIGIGIIVVALAIVLVYGR